ncbi:unnamed protein product [Protopolystoma xenopodis]|uniref:IRS-type PTB domain-containing protein n=1 Tax=Protopolystoma xenopodis TaxID=117903 RepID=A0A448WMZ1_9PLAT|nr:unnamed protein product [Protopolystoma xenopodis]
MILVIDFGEHCPGGNYVIQTTEGERIAQLLSGYIDIIMRKQRNREAALLEGDEESTIVEENVEPEKANLIQNLTGTLPTRHRVEEVSLAHSGVLRPAAGAINNLLRNNFNQIASTSHTAIPVALQGPGSATLQQASGSTVSKFLFSCIQC